ncbi:MAG: NIPSNAP family protein [Flavipsychrobacter sp.]|jgi:hypothetical protein|nr:NIPSNAP family protein [Flavipsychrobacter sp.]
MLRLILLTLLSLTFINSEGQTKKEWYELRIYRYENQEQKASILRFAEEALLPALHRLKIKNIGVLEPSPADTISQPAIYIIFSFSSVQAAADCSVRLEKDPVYQQTAAFFINAPFDKPPFTRLETVWMKSFKLAPPLQTPEFSTERQNRIYELRNYESATADRYKSKVHMFNEGGEIELFKELDFNAAFYGEVITGSRMPNFYYLTCFENFASREAHWKTFFSHPKWKEMLAKEMYKNNVSKAGIHLLRPASCSDW